MRLGWVFIDIFGLMYSFGLALFVVQGMVHLHVWELVVRSTFLHVTMGRQICPERGPPVCGHGPPLSHDISDKINEIN